jgi:hypothetical protein
VHDLLGIDFLESEIDDDRRRRIVGEAMDGLRGVGHERALEPLPRQRRTQACAGCFSGRDDENGVVARAHASALHESIARGGGRNANPTLTGPPAQRGLGLQ